MEISSFFVVENYFVPASDHPEIFDEIDHKVRVHFGLIEEDETVKPLDKTEEEAPLAEEVTLDLDDAIEIED